MTGMVTVASAAYICSITSLWDGTNGTGHPIAGRTTHG
jgi:hypothetical protein